MRFQTLYEGRWIFAVLLAVAALGVLLHWSWLIVLAALLIVFCVNFFRDPEREIPADPNAIVAAADGVVVDVIEMEEDEVVKAKMRRIAIFLNVFDVHVNRAPAEGKVTYIQHHGGLYLDARNLECSLKNERLTWAFEGPRATLVVRQITGAIARRIVPWSRLGDTLQKGERFGMIRFGSRTEVFIPLECEVLVQPGERVAGGSTIVARFPAKA